MALTPNDPRHGTVNGYCNLSCRCQPCRDAWAKWVRDCKIKRTLRLRNDPSLVPHGRASTYGNWGCRCQPCTTAHTESRKAYRQRRQVEAKRLRRLASQEAA